MVDSSGDARISLSCHPKQPVVDDMLGDGGKDDGLTNVKADLGSGLAFPSGFPYDFDFLSDSSALASPVELVLDSTEGENSDDEEDFLAGLARRLTQSSIRETRKLPVSSYSSACDRFEKFGGLAHSPQSTLTGMEGWSAGSAISSEGSPNGPSQAPSPTSTPFAAKNDSWDVIFAAAGQVARLNVNGQVPSNSVTETRGPFSAHHTASRACLARSPNNVIYQAPTFAHAKQQLNQLCKQLRQEQIFKQQHSAFLARQDEISWLLKQQQMQSRGESNGCHTAQRVHSKRVPQTAWPPLQAHHGPLQSRHCGSAIGGVPPARSGVKRQCAGTGVFLPRHYDGAIIEPGKKTSYSSVSLPNKIGHNRSLDAQTKKQPRFTSGFPSEQELMIIARRNAVLLQQRRPWRHNEAVNPEARLPQDWAY